MTAPASVGRLTLTVDELAAMVGISPRLVRKLVQTQGHVLDVAPVPHTGRRIVFPRVPVERALGVETAAS